VRWLMSALSVVGLCAGAVLSVSIIVAPESAWSERSAEVSAAAQQYSSEDQGYSVEPPQGDTPAPSDVGSPKTEHPIRLAHEGDAAAEDPQAGSSGSVSEGTVSGARAPEEALSIMEPPAPYAQLVDNSSVGWFSGRRGWEVKRAGSKAQTYGLDYGYAKPSEVGHPARFRVNIPATDYYTVYARWPALKRNNAATLFGVNTTSGIEWTEVDQRRDGGMWVRLGAYEMEAGERYAVQVSGYRATGWVVADAVMVVRGTQMAPPETDPGAVVGALVAGEGQDVVELAREHIGTPYIHSPPGPCEAYRSEDCSCLTSLVFAEGLGITMPDHPVVQWNYGQDVAKSDLRPGDLVFFKEAGPNYPITHVGIYSGMGNIVHASSYWGTVVERPMEYIDGYYGAKRLVGD
jgi:hypothetical protein